MRGPVMLTAEQAEAVYAILVEDAGAHPRDAKEFARYASTTRPVEWRLMGVLGYGGKLYFAGWKAPWVGCYPEDETPERTRVIERVNARLTALWAEQAIARLSPAQKGRP